MREVILKSLKKHVKAIRHLNDERVYDNGIKFMRNSFKRYYRVDPNKYLLLIDSISDHLIRFRYHDDIDSANLVLNFYYNFTNIDINNLCVLEKKLYKKKITVDSIEEFIDTVKFIENEQKMQTIWKATNQSYKPLELDQLIDFFSDKKNAFKGLKTNPFLDIEYLSELYQLEEKIDKNQFKLYLLAFEPFIRILIKNNKSLKKDKKLADYLRRLSEYQKEIKQKYIEFKVNG